MGLGDGASPNQYVSQPSKELSSVGLLNPNQQANKVGWGGWSPSERILIQYGSGQNE